MRLRRAEQADEAVGQGTIGQNWGTNYAEVSSESVYTAWELWMEKAEVEGLGNRKIVEADKQLAVEVDQDAWRMVVRG